MEKINKEVMKTKFKIIFNNLLLDSENYLKVITLYNNGFYFKTSPKANTLLNKYLIKI